MDRNNYFLNLFTPKSMLILLSIVNLMSTIIPSIKYITDNTVTVIFNYY